MPINSGGFEPAKQEKIIFTTPVPKIENPHICIHYPIAQDLSRIIMTVDRSGKKPKMTGAERKKNEESKQHDQEVFDSSKHPLGRYVESPKHHKHGQGDISKARKDGQKALDNSYEVKKTSSRRISYSNGEFVVLDQTSAKIFHGHVREWDQLEEKMQNKLIDNNVVNDKGKPIK